MSRIEQSSLAIVADIARKSRTLSDPRKKNLSYFILNVRSVWHTCPSGVLLEQIKSVRQRLQLMASWIGGGWFSAKKQAVSGDWAPHVAKIFVYRCCQFRCKDMHDQAQRINCFVIVNLKNKSLPFPLVLVKFLKRSSFNYHNQRNLILQWGKYWTTYVHANCNLKQL